MSFEFILAKEGDRAFCRDAHHVAYRNTIEKMFGWDEADQNDRFDAEFDSRDLNIIVKDAQRIGIVSWEEREDCLWLGSFYLLPEYQGSGYGSQLLNVFIEKAEELNKPFRLQTLLANEGAKKLYERHGLCVIETTDTNWILER